MNPRTILAATVLALSSLAAQAQTQVQDAWVRGTVPAQKATGAFMDLTGKSTARLVAAESPVAGKTVVFTQGTTNERAMKAYNDEKKLGINWSTKLIVR